MAELVFERAREEAKTIRAAYHVPTGGTSGLENIAAQLGAEVIFAPLEQDEAGFIVKKKGESLASIVINSNDIVERQRFTLAHEMGHLVACKVVAGATRYSCMDYHSRRNGYNLHEFFADEFAGELLMPAVPLLTRLSNSSRYETAVRFGVTLSALDRRMTRLQENPPEELACLE